MGNHQSVKLLTLTAGALCFTATASSAAAFAPPPNGIIAGHHRIAAVSRPFGIAPVASTKSSDAAAAETDGKGGPVSSYLDNLKLVGGAEDGNKGRENQEERRVLIPPPPPQATSVSASKPVHVASSDAPNAATVELQEEKRVLIPPPPSGATAASASASAPVDTTTDPVPVIGSGDINGGGVDAAASNVEDEIEAEAAALVEKLMARSAAGDVGGSATPSNGSATSAEPIAPTAAAASSAAPKDEEKAAEPGPGAAAALVPEDAYDELVQSVESFASKDDSNKAEEKERKEEVVDFWEQKQEMVDFRERIDKAHDVENVVRERAKEVEFRTEKEEGQQQQRTEERFQRALLSARLDMEVKAKAAARVEAAAEEAAQAERQRIAAAEAKKESIKSEVEAEERRLKEERLALERLEAERKAAREAEKEREAAEDDAMRRRIAAAVEAEEQRIAKAEKEEEARRKEERFQRALLSARLDMESNKARMESSHDDKAQEREHLAADETHVLEQARVDEDEGRFGEHVQMVENEDHLEHEVLGDEGRLTKEAVRVVDDVLQREEDRIVTAKKEEEEEKDKEVAEVNAAANVIEEAIAVSAQPANSKVMVAEAADAAAASEDQRKNNNAEEEDRQPLVEVSESLLDEPQWDVEEVAELLAEAKVPEEPKVAAQQQLVVSEPKTPKTPPFWSTVQPSEITGAAISTLSPERGALQLMDEPEIDIVKFAATRLAMAAFDAGKAGVFAAAGTLETVRSPEVARAIRTAAGRAGEAARSMADETDRNNKDGADAFGDMLRLCGTVAGALGEAAGTFFSALGSAEATRSAAEATARSTNELSSFFAACAALGLKQGGKIPEYAAKLKQEHAAARRRAEEARVEEERRLAEELERMAAEKRAMEEISLRVEAEKRRVDEERAEAERIALEEIRRNAEEEKLRLERERMEAVKMVKSDVDKWRAVKINTETKERKTDNEFFFAQ